MSTLIIVASRSLETHPITDTWSTSVPAVTKTQQSKWSLTGRMQHGRILHTASVLSNGKVLVTGGFSTGGDAFHLAELYDPSTRMWTNAGNMQVNRTCHTASMLTNGNILVTSGGLTFDLLSHTAELYNSSTETFIDFNSINNLQSSHKTFMLTNGKISVISESNPKTFNDRPLR